MSTEIAIPLPAAILEAVTNKNRKARKKSLYTTEEITVIGKYKKEFREKTTTDDRNEILRNHILVDIFNYWFSKGIVTAEIAADVLSDRIKV